MREFKMVEDYWDNDDLQNALEYNPPKLFNPVDITHIVAEVCGQNDELAWWWVLRMVDNRYFLLSGYCDYTGWDCYSKIKEYGYFDTAIDAANRSPEVEKSSHRKIRENLIRQIKGEQPLFTYMET